MFPVGPVNLSAVAFQWGRGTCRLLLVAIASIMLICARNFRVSDLWLRSSALVVCLRDRVAPLLHGRYTDAVGRRLFTAAAHLSRLAGWTAFDRGHHAAAQRHYVQALRLARAAGDVAFGGYTLACAALQATLRGWHDHAIDMCQGAHERAKHQAPARVLAFTALIEARAHALAGDRRAAAHALSTSERLLGQAERQQGVEPDWIDFYSPARMAADAVEIHRDLHLPAAARRWNEQAAMPTDQFARSYGLRLTVLATTHLQGPSPDVDLALEYGRHALDVLSTISSARANDYTHDLARRLVPWKDHGPARDLIHRIRTDVPFT